jgi:hypothetical protein
MMKTLAQYLDGQALPGLSNRVRESRIFSGSGEDIRVVLSERPCYRGPYEERFHTHCEILPKDRPAYMIWGHYDLTREDAERDFHARVGLASGSWCGQDGE